MKLSIILPVYNTAAFLRQNLDSILSQVKDDAVELIIVNDGSTDDSAVILDEYAAKYSEIQLYHRSNQGVYPVRNFALSKANGDYLWMLDSDDYLLDGALARIFSEISVAKTVDIFNLGYQIEYKDKTVHQDHAQSETPICSGVEYLEQNFGSFFLWRNVYRRSFLEEHHLKFEAKVFSLEDTLFNIRTYSLAKTVKVIKTPYYFYRYNNTSISKKPSLEKIKRRADSSMYVHQQLKTDIEAIPKNSPRYKVMLGQLNFSVMGFFL